MLRQAEYIFRFYSSTVSILIRLLFILSVMLDPNVARRVTKGNQPKNSQFSLDSFLINLIHSGENSWFPPEMRTGKA